MLKVCIKALFTTKSNNKINIFHSKQKTNSLIKMLTGLIRTYQNKTRELLWFVYLLIIIGYLFIIITTFNW